MSASHPTTIRKSLNLLYCGGMACEDQKKISRKSLTKETFGKWVEQSVEFNFLSRVFPTFISSAPSSELPLDAIGSIARHIAKTIDRFDGYIITHDADQLLFHADLLGFMLSGTPKPIIFLSGDESRSKKGNSLSRKIVQAMRVMDSNIAEVMVFQSNDLFRATHLSSVPGDSLFVSSGLPALQKINENDRALKNFFHPQTAIHLRPHASSRVFIAEARTGNFGEIMDNISPKSIHGVLLLGSNDEPVQKQLEDQLIALSRQNIPIGIFSQTQKKSWIERENPFIVSGMTWEAAMAKFCWGLGQTRNSSLMRKIMLVNVIGEMVDTARSNEHETLYRQQIIQTDNFQSYLDSAVKHFR